MARPRNLVPTYLRHPDGRAFCWVYPPSGRRRAVYLGEHGSPESYAEYRRLLAQIEGGMVRDSGSRGLSVAELVERFLAHADLYYRSPADGKRTSEYAHFAAACAVLCDFYGATPADEFGPLALKHVRDGMVLRKWSRKTVNAQARRVRQVWRWAAENEIVPADRWQALKAVKALAAGRSAARETPPVAPAPVADVERTLPFLPPPVAAMARVQLLTACRPQEVCRLRGDQLDRSAAVWVFRPAAHKGSWRGKVREVFVGPQAQGVLAPWLDDAGDGHVFSPRREVERQRCVRSAGRKTPRYPSHTKRNQEKRVARPRRPPAERYTTASYGRAVLRGCRKAGVAPWTPLQLRHTAGTRFRELFGIEVARVLLGHASVATSEIYAEPSRAKAVEAMAEAG